MTPRRFDVFGTALSPHPREGEPLPLVTELAARAEEYGLDGLLAFYNHKNLDPWAVASAILNHTKALTPLVALQPYALPPFTAAKLIHTLSRLHGRQIDVNLITGAANEELIQVGETLDHDQRYERAVEYATVLRHLLSSDEPLVHEGRHYRYQGLRTHSRLEPEQRPRIFVAGSSTAGKRAAAQIGDIAVTHPEPVDAFAQTFLREDGTGPRTGIRIGLVARPTDDEAWEAAHTLYPGDRMSELKTAMRKRSESDWSRRLAYLASGKEQTYDEVYWTGAYRADKGSMPLLVGSYRKVAAYLDRYLALGVDTVLLGGLLTEEDFRHSAVVLDGLRSGDLVAG
ncbi:LLM class flavin-dependent oxidoreductase [Streptomyces sp. SBST2-5]|uniref:LLM class flavin-dependent oxidoreductase n=1 Tax=Streptomyces composti TaxID=2720025 RepID=A0ABX1ADZ3_9ACTN|nr:LLM class flavin-dependent oxidoreductase [Streptomyces composti]NJP52691.1 LLM class flavin-dependent oxidoreductase [Streptomyces composti]